MQVCKLVYRLVNKNKGSIILFGCIFIAITVMMVTMGGNKSTAEYTSSKVKVAVFNEDDSDLSQALVSYMKEKNRVVKVKKDEDSITNALFYREIQYVITIPDGFGEAIAKGEEIKIETRKLPGSFTTSAVDMELNDYVQTFQSFQKLGYSNEESIEKTLSSLESKLDVKLENDSEFGGNQVDFLFYFQYYAYVIFAMSISSIGPVLMLFYRREIQKRNLCSSMKFSRMNLQIGLSCVSVIMAILVVLMGIGMVLYGKEKGFFSVFPYLLLNAFDLTLVAVGVVFIAGMVAKSDIMLSGISNVVSLGFSFLGGVFVPMEVMSKEVLAFSRYLPSYWYIKAIDAISNFGGKSEAKFMAQMWKALGIEFAFAIALFVIGILISKRKVMES